MHLLRNIILISILALVGCQLEQEVDLNLPDYEPEVVVECYLQPGGIHALTLTRSTGYFDDIQIQFVKNADVSITHEGNTIQLEPFAIPLDFNGQGLIDTSFLQLIAPIVGDSLYLYASLTPVPEDFDSEFTLEINTPTGENITASTFLPTPVPIDTMEYKFNDDSLAFVLTKWQDNPNEINFYRRILEKRRKREVEGPNGEIMEVWDSREEQNFIIDDDIENGETIVIGTAFDYEFGDTLIARTQHITEDYYNFILTTDAAFTANLSPFGQPASIQSNISGGIGIFTGFTETNRILVVGQ